MSTTVVIPERVNGPPDSANGGYTCGAMAGLLDVPAGTAVQATLRRPPPLGRPLYAEVDTDGRRVTLHDGETLVGEAVVAEPGTSGDADTVDGTPAPISLDAADAVAADFDTAGYVARHPFPACFTCGPDRTGADGDGLRIFPGARGPHLVAWPWTPDAALAASDGLVDAVYVWAALDCPSGLCWFHDEPDAGPHVLGRMSASVLRRPAPGEPLVVAGWTIATEGRKRRTGSIVWDAGGTPIATNLSTWIALDARTATTFRPATATPDQPPRP
jgi:hypothetical protein